MTRDIRRTPRIDDMSSSRRKSQRSSRRDSRIFEKRKAVPYDVDWGGSAPPGFVNGLSGPAKPGRSTGGRINGLRGGRTNGLPNGHINGLKRGWVYGFTNGTVNGVGNGRINGLKNGRTNGLKNGRVNGLSNGRVNGVKNGRTNGNHNGHSNGNGRKNGLINGNGFINGFRLTSAPKIIPLSKKNPSLRIAAVFAVVALVVIIPFLLVYSMPADAIKIDGYFFDWDRAGYFSESAATAASDIDIQEYSIVISGDRVYGYIATAGTMFPQGDRPDSYFVFFEMDNDPGTGYIIDGIGADTMVEISGWNGSVRPSSSRVYDFSSTAERNAFTGWESGRSINVMGSDNKIEFSFTEFSVGDPVARFFSKSYAGNEDASLYSIGFGHAALRVQANLTLAEVISAGHDEGVMEMELSALRGSVGVSSITFNQLGNATRYNISVFDGGTVLGRSNSPTVSFSPELEVREGYGRLLSVSVSADAGQDGASFGLSLSSPSIVVSNGATVTAEERQSGAKVAYIGVAPGGVVIDGAFADWVNGVTAADASGDVVFPAGTANGNRSIDIQEYGMYVDANDVAMYLSVEDHIMNGTILPKDVRLPVPSTGLPNFASPEMIGADIAGAVIDADLNLSTGADVNGALGGDYLVLITGKKGRVVSSELYAWNPAGNGSWDLKDQVRCAVDRKHMEFAFAKSNVPLGDNDTAVVEFFMTDWKEGIDYSDEFMLFGNLQFASYMKAFGGILLNEVLNTKGQVDYIELFNTGSDPITMTGWTVYDGTRLIYTFGTVTVNPNEVYVIYDLSISKIGSLRLLDQSGAVVDLVNAKENANDRSYSRIGDPPYSTWRQTPQSPGVTNPGQVVVVPEFSDIIIPVLFISAMFFLFRKRRRGAKDA